VAGATSLTGNLTVDGGTIKLDGNYPVGTGNVALGDTALDSLTTGEYNTALGAFALTANTSGSYSTAVGYVALRDNTTGLNSAFGPYAAYQTTTGTNNTALGASTLDANTTGSYNTAVGMNALQNNTTGIDNTAVGYQAGYTNTTDSYNTYLGDHAGYAATNWKNTFLGHASGEAVTTGAANTILGRYDGNQGGLDIRTSNNNIVLSDGDGNPLMHYSGNNMQNVSTSHLRIYNKTNNTTAVSFRTAGVQRGYIQVTDSSVAYNTSSDYRLKENVDYTWDATTRLKQLKPARFNFIAEPDTTVDGFLSSRSTGSCTRVQYTGTLQTQLTQTVLL
jgi:trimeric autotransporter adhesin